MDRPTRRALQSAPVAAIFVTDLVAGAKSKLSFPDPEATESHGYRNVGAMLKFKQICVGFVLCFQGD